MKTGITESRETSAQASIGVPRKLAKFIGIAASTELDSKSRSATWKASATEERTEHIIPETLLTASGITEGAHGAYVKLKPSPRTTLQGSHQIVVLAEVPNTFQGSIFYASTLTTLKNVSSKGSSAHLLSVFDENSAPKRKISTHLAATLNNSKSREELVSMGSFWQAMWAKRLAGIETFPEIMNRSSKLGDTHPAKTLCPEAFSNLKETNAILSAYIASVPERFASKQKTCFRRCHTRRHPQRKGLDDRGRQTCFSRPNGQREIN